MGAAVTTVVLVLLCLYVALVTVQLMVRVRRIARRIARLLKEPEPRHLGTRHCQTRHHRRQIKARWLA